MLSVGLPAVIVIVIGVPVSGLLVLYCQRSRLRDPLVKAKFGMW